MQQPQQQYSLRWNNHQPNFISMFASLLRTKTLVDVTLAAEGKHLYAHRLVLSACSTFFQTVFTETPSNHPIVILKDVTFDNLVTVVDFIYYGTVNVTEAQLPQVLETARILKVKGLTEMQGPSSTDMQDMGMSQRPPTPSTSPRRKRRRRSSAASQSGGCDGQNEDAQNVELGVNDQYSLNNDQRRRESNEDRPLDNQHQNDQQLGVECPMPIQHDSQNIQPDWSLMDQSSYQRSYPNVGESAGMYNSLMNFNSQQVEMAFGGGVAPAAGPSADPTGDTPPVPRRRRTHNPQAEENFQRALDAVRFGGIGFCKAARMFGVNNRTLWLEFKKKGYQNNRPSIKNRIKKEHASPPPLPEMKEDPSRQDHQDHVSALICPPPAMFIERPLDFQLQGVAHNSSINLLPHNFNVMQ